MQKIDSKLVSVVLCTYNGEPFLEVQLNSLLSQTYKNIEIIIIDDKSTDKTFQIAELFSQNFSNIKCFQNDFNLGINENMAYGFSLAKGKYICPCDQDDYWLFDKVDKLVKKIQDSTVDLVYCDSYFTDENLNNTFVKESDKYRFIRGNDPRMIFYQNCVSGHAILFKKDILSKALPFALKPGYYDYCLSMTA